VKKRHQAVCKAEIPLANGKPPTEFRIWAFGDVRTTKGDFKCTEAGAALLMATYRDQGNDLVFDYEHQTIYTCGDSPAAGWFSLEQRADGIWATGINWTPNAFSRLENKEYRYFSPVFYYDEGGAITELVNIALTNVPATKDLEPLVASRSHDGRSPVVASALSFQEVTGAIGRAIQLLWGWEAYVCEVYDDFAVFERGGRLYSVSYTMTGTQAILSGEATEVHRSYTPIEGETTMKTVLKALNLGETETEAVALSAVNGLQNNERQVLTLTGKGTLPEAIGVLTAWKASADTVATLSARVTELETEKSTQALDGLIALGKAAGQISPAFEPAARGMGIVALTAFLEHAPKLVATAGEKQPDAPAASALSEAELAVCKQTGTDPKVFAARKAELFK
jgi:phage I-like protein